MVMRAILNTLWGLMIAIRILAIAAIPLAMIATIYLLFVYGIWSHVVSAHHQERKPATTWFLSAASLAISLAGLYGLHELGRWHRAQKGLISR